MMIHWNCFIFMENVCEDYFMRIVISRVTVANLRGVKNNNNNLYFNIMAMKKFFFATTKPIKIYCSNSSIIIILTSFIILFILYAVVLPKYISILCEHTRALFTFGMICVCICIKRSSFYSILYSRGVGGGAGNVDRDERYIYSGVDCCQQQKLISSFWRQKQYAYIPYIERTTRIMHHDTSCLSFCYFIYVSADDDAAAALHGVEWVELRL